MSFLFSRKGIMSMKTIIEALKEKEDLLAGKGVSGEMIVEAEKEIGLKFAEDYRLYLKTFGIAAYGGHELTGITKSERVHVVAATKKEREHSPELPSNIYVIEHGNIDGIVIWQADTGEIYGAMPGHGLKQINDSLVDYVCQTK